VILIDLDHVCPRSPRFRCHHHWLIYLLRAVDHHLLLLMADLRMLPSEVSARLTGKDLEEAGGDGLAVVEGAEEAESEVGEPGIEKEEVGKEEKGEEEPVRVGRRGVRKGREVG